jgi:hypothetical protein
MRAAALLVIAWLCTACGVGAPLMHAAHPMPEGEVTLGGGFSGSVPLVPAALSSEIDTRILEEGALSPGLAPWVGGRYGIDGDFDAGLTYTGRSVRVDARRAWVLGDPALSVGLGASGLLPERGDDPAAGEEYGYRVGGFGGDLPILIGWKSQADIYALWLGARGGIEHLRGSRDVPPDPGAPELLLSEEISGWHATAGGLLGFRIGFRYIFAVLELDATMHWAGGEIGGREVSARQFAIVPAGAVVGRF